MERRPTKRGGFLFVGAQRRERRASGYAPRNGEVVQRREGLRLYLPGRGRRGPLRALLRDSRRRVQVPGGGHEGLLRGDAGQEGDAGGERLSRLTSGRPTGNARAGAYARPSLFAEDPLTAPRAALPEGGSGISIHPGQGEPVLPGEPYGVGVLWGRDEVLPVDAPDLYAAPPVR